MKKYRAKAKGYDGKQIREAGEIFEFEGKPGKWMELVEAQAKEEKSEKPAEAPHAEKPAKPKKAHKDVI